MKFRLNLAILAIFLQIISVGDRILEVERLVAALSEIKRLYSKTSAGLLDHEYIKPIVVCSPAGRIL